MDALITFLTVVGGLLLSVAVAVAVEEFIFGQIFKLFFRLPNQSQTKPSPSVPVLAAWIAHPVRVRHVTPR